jgi:putative endonuclease
MPTKLQVIEQLDFLSDRISTQVRTVSLGVLALTWGLLIGESQVAKALSQQWKTNLVGIGATAILVMFLDFLQYAAGYRDNMKLREKMNRAGLGETEYAGGAYIAVFAMCASLESAGPFLRQGRRRPALQQGARRAPLQRAIAPSPVGANGVRPLRTRRSVPPSGRAPTGATERPTPQEQCRGFQFAILSPGFIGTKDLALAKEFVKRCFVYIMTNRSRTLYTGVTNNLARRVLEHKLKLVPGFTSKYNIRRLVYFELFGDARAAIGREKQIKGWLRAKKIALIESTNPDWKDLSEGWYGKRDPSSRRGRDSG